MSIVFASFKHPKLPNSIKIPVALSDCKLFIYTEQKWKRYTTIIYILWESIGQKVFTKA